MTSRKEQAILNIQPRYDHESDWIDSEIELGMIPDNSYKPSASHSRDIGLTGISDGHAEGQHENIMPHPLAAGELKC